MKSYLLLNDDFVAMSDWHPDCIAQQVTTLNVFLANPKLVSSTVGMSENDFREKIYNRVNEILLKLLDAIDEDITAGRLPSPHLEAYEAMLRAETARRG